ncbi:MAG TPA: hypothetical protein VLY23_11535 [Candidatus Acidoferrum sp.]|nr:hypothetical protein [Candidatus Acidoferrum sp.]
MRRPAAQQRLAQALAFQQLRNNERTAFVLADVVDGDDIRMA